MDGLHRSFELLQAGDTQALRRLLNQEPATADANDAAGVSLLMNTIYRGQRDLAEAIADKKQSLDIFEAAALGRIGPLNSHLRDATLVNSYSPDGFTALHFASYFGQPDVAKLLLEKGAKVDAVANNPTHVMPLHSAASSRNLVAARLLLEQGAPVNARQQAGFVPLHAAAQNGDVEMVELLLSHGAEAGITNDAGKTAAMIALHKGHTQIAERLKVRVLRS